MTGGPGGGLDGGLAHELRGRLTVVVGEIELVLADDAVAPQARAESAARALEALWQIEALVGTAADAGARP